MVLVICSDQFRGQSIFFCDYFFIFWQCLLYLWIFTNGNFLLVPSNRNKVWTKIFGNYDKINQCLRTCITRYHGSKSEKLTMCTISLEFCHLRNYCYLVSSKICLTGSFSCPLYSVSLKNATSLKKEKMRKHIITHE